MGILAGKVAFVTGAGRGIGRACAMAYAGEGASLILVARTAAEIEATAGEIAALGGTALAVSADVADAEAVEGAAAKGIERFGRIDILVSNAGNQGPGAAVWEVDPAAWRRTLDVNLWGAFLCCRFVLPHMIAQRSGKVIVVSSGAWQHPMPFFSGYAASKAGATHFTRTIAAELKPYGITANTIGVRGITRMWDDVLQAGPGGGTTTADIRRQVAEGLAPRVEENLPVLLFLASPASDHLTGQYLEANSLPGCDVDARPPREGQP